MDLNEVFSGSHLKVADLNGQDVPVTIAGYEVVDFDDGRKVVLSFSGTDKSLVCNKTNATTIADLHGTLLEGWIGKKIVLFPTQTDFQGKQVACIRVRLNATVQAVAEKFTGSTDDGVPF